MTEAAQARLAYISGARDDLDPSVTMIGQRAELETDFGKALSALRSAPSLVADLEDVITRTEYAFDSAPLVCELTCAEIGIPVVRVVVPRSVVNPKVF